jgi:hypothetical protein
MQSPAKPKGGAAAAKSAGAAANSKENKVMSITSTPLDGASFDF